MAARRPLLRSLALLAALGAGPALAQGSDAGAEAYARDNTVFTLYHEFGHLFVDRFDLPVLAREEDAVDNLATLMALDDYGKARDRSVLGNAVYGWELAMGEDGTGAPEPSALYDSHSLNGQRAFTMLCLLVGKDKAAFGAAAAEWGMDEDRQESCADDYAQARAGWDRVLAPHRRPAAGAGAPIAVRYEAASGDTRAARRLLRAGKVLETFAARMEAEFAMPERVRLRAADCDEDNAYYDADERSVTVCYELVNYYLSQYDEAPAVDAPGRAGPGGDDVRGESARYARPFEVNRPLDPGKKRARPRFASAPAHATGGGPDQPSLASPRPCPEPSSSSATARATGT